MSLRLVDILIPATETDFSAELTRRAMVIWMLMLAALMLLIHLD